MKLFTCNSYLPSLKPGNLQYDNHLRLSEILLNEVDIKLKDPELVIWFLVQ